MTDRAIDAADVFAPEVMNGDRPEQPEQAESADFRDQVIEQQAQQIEQLNHFIQLQANTIAAFQNRTWKLEMEIVELMSQVPQVGAQPVFGPGEISEEPTDDTG